jgi:hypothetical protein
MRNDAEERTMAEIVENVFLNENLLKIARAIRSELGRSKYRRDVRRVMETQARNGTMAFYSEIRAFVRFHNANYPEPLDQDCVRDVYSALAAHSARIICKTLLDAELPKIGENQDG